MTRSVFIWLPWLLSSFFYAYQYVIRVLPNIMMPDIMARFSIDASLFGQFSGVYYIGYTLMHIPLGILLDRIGPKIIMPVCVLLIVLGLLPLTLADHWFFPIAGRFLIGMGSSAAILGVFKVLRMNFPENKFTRMLGISVMIGLLGALYGGEPVNAILQIYGASSLVWFLIGGGVLMGLLLYFTIPSFSKTTISYKASLSKELKDVFLNSKVIFICLLGGLMVGPLEGFADVWGTQYLKKAYDLDQTTAAFLPSLIFLGMCIGSPLVSYIADKFQAYIKLIVISGLWMGIGFTFLLLGWIKPSFLPFLFFTTGVFCAYQILVIFKASTYVKENLVGLCTAVANMIVMTFGYLFHTFIGKVMDLIQGEKLNGQVDLYTLDAFVGGLSIIPFGLFLGTLGFFFLLFSTKTKLEPHASKSKTR